MVEYGVYDDSPKRKHSTGQRAGFGLRLAAYLIDAIIAGVVAFLLGLGLAFVLLPDTAVPTAAYEQAVVQLQCLSYIIGFAINILVFSYVPSVWEGRTVGKNLLGLRIVSETEQPLNFGRLFLRNFVGYFVSSLVFYVGFLWVIWDEDKQGWHDKIANTVVVRDR